MKKWLISIVIVLLMAGCQIIEEHSERELADNDRTLQIARNRIPVVKSQICFVKGLGRVEELPVKAVAAMDEFLVLAEDPNSMTDCELAYSLGLGVQFYEACILNVFPEFMRFWP